MGWTGYMPTHFTKSGNINRKAECDAYFMEGLNKGRFSVLKSVMKGSVYYAAVKNMVRYDKETDTYEPIDDGTVWGIVFLTSVEKGMFYYKDMSEDMGPCYYDCPETILKLLSETDSKWALEWRQKCHEKNEQAKIHNLSNLVIGTEIIWTRSDGTTVELVKHAPAYQFKRPFWFNAADWSYVPAKRIQNWEIKAE